MKSIKRPVVPTMHGPAIYRLRVRGRLDASWSDRVGGVQITAGQGPDGKAETILVGRFVDQAALSGVLNALYELHLPVLSVDCLESENSDDFDRGPW